MNDAKRYRKWFGLIFIVSGIVLGFALSTLATPAVADTFSFIAPYPGATRTEEPVIQFDSRDFAVGRTANGSFVKKRLEGRINSITDVLPENRSVLEVARNYEQGLKKAGFQILMSCNGDDYQTNCGYGETGNKEVGTLDYGGHYIAARLARAGGDIYVGIKVNRGAAYMLVLQEKPMDTNLVKVSAKSLGDGINADGHIAVYGINFDTDKATIKPESSAVITEIAKLLKEQSAIKLYVVGHTDNVGDLAHNMDLSKRRANAVMTELVSKHGIAAARLKADGIGPLAPVASNKTEEGRYKNRRVELVGQ